MSETWWVIEHQGLCVGFGCQHREKWVTFSDAAAKRFKQRGDAQLEADQLEARFPYLKGRLAVTGHMWMTDAAALSPSPAQQEAGSA